MSDVRVITSLRTTREAVAGAAEVRAGESEPVLPTSTTCLKILLVATVVVVVVVVVVVLSNCGGEV
jgi:hypothetical protein